MKYYIDNLYTCYVGNNIFIFKHVFRPNPKCGKNSAAIIKDINKIKKPKKCYELKDQTKNELYYKKETI